MSEFDVEVDLYGKPVVFKLKPLTYGQRNNCLRRSSVVKVSGTTPDVSVDLYMFNELRLMEAIVEPVVYKTLEKVRELPVEVGDKLIAELDKVSSVLPLGSGESGKQ